MRDQVLPIVLTAEQKWDAYDDAQRAKDMRTQPSRLLSNPCPYCNSDHDPSIQCRNKPNSERGQLNTQLKKSLGKDFDLEARREQLKSMSLKELLTLAPAFRGLSLSRSEIVEAILKEGRVEGEGRLRSQTARAACEGCFRT